MNRRKLIYFLSAFVLIIGCYALNLSYSLFTQNILSENNVVDTTIPIINASLENDTFSIPANSSKVIELKIINSGTADIRYGISLEDTKGTTIQLVEGYSIVDTIESTKEKEVLVYVTNSTDTEITNLTFELTTKYLTLNFDENFINTSNIDCVNVVKLLKSAILNRANNITEEESKTLGYAMYSETLRTTPAEMISELDESLLLETEDDHTAITGQNSYYFRGNVKNNYVNFAGMCWRIVRIQGDRSIKLILDDKNTTCDDKETEITSAVYTGNSYIGTGNYGYETPQRSSLIKINYLQPITDNTSSMAKAFYDFQTTGKLKDYIDKLKSGDWCLGNIAYTRSGETNSYAYTLLEDTSNNYLSETPFYYDAYKRLTSEKENSYQPTLKCNGTILDNFANVDSEGITIMTETPMYVSTITADEIVYAGGSNSKFNADYYLIKDNDKNSRFFWTLSPSYFSGAFDFAFGVSTYGLLDELDVSVWDVNNVGIGFRPVVSLLPNAVITSGEGIQENPYVIG